MTTPSLAARVRHEVVFYRDWAVELLDETTRHLGFVIRTVDRDRERGRNLFELGRDWAIGHGQSPAPVGWLREAPKACRVTSTGQRLIRVV